MPLSVQQVLKLRNLLRDELRPAFDRAFAGYALMCLYGRARQSDSACIDWLEVDVCDGAGYVVVYTRSHKTSCAARRKNQALPIIIPSTSVEDREWLLTVKDMFEAIGLAFEGGINGPLFRPLLDFENGRLANRGITSAEATAFLRVALDVSPASEGPRISSHSLKRTPCRGLPRRGSARSAGNVWAGVRARFTARMSSTAWT